MKASAQTLKINGLPIPANIWGLVFNLTLSGAKDNIESLRIAVETVANEIGTTYGKAAEIWTACDPLNLRLN